METAIDNLDGITGQGVTEIIDPLDLRNGRLPKVSADAEFYAICEWLLEETRAASYSFFTNVGIGFTGETLVVFTAVRGGASRHVMIDAAQLRTQDRDPQGRVIYEGSATARCALELAFDSRFTPRKLWPGPAPKAGNPIGNVRPDWGSGPMYEFAEGTTAAEFPETDPARNQPLYRFFVEGEWLVFARTKKLVLKNGKGTVVPAWRLQGR